jgi:hypothetical protein
MRSGRTGAGCTGLYCMREGSDNNKREERCVHLGLGYVTVLPKGALLRISVFGDLLYLSFSRVIEVLQNLKSADLRCM